MAAPIGDVLTRMRARLPGAVELVYDNYNALAIGFASGERVADVIFSVACFPRWVSLFFFPGVDLEDPENLLKGSGTKCQHIVLRSPAMLDAPGVSALMRPGTGKIGTSDRRGRREPPRDQIRFRETAPAPPPGH
jgi:hypothetical protein